MSQLKAVSTLLSASMFGQLLGLLSLPLITRLISAEQYGVFSYFLAVFALLSPLVSMNLPQALALTTSSRQQQFIQWLTLATAVRMVLLIFLLLIATLLLVPDFLPGTLLLWLSLPVLLFINAFNQLQQQILLLNKAFAQVAKVELSQSLSLNLGKILAALLLPLAWSLVLATFIARLIALRLLLRYLPLPWRKYPLLLKRRAKLWRRWLRYKDFVFYQTPQLAFNALSQYGPVLLLSLFLGPVIAGFYMLAKTVVEAPASLVNKVVADIFYPFIAGNKVSKLPLLPLLKKVTLSLASLAILPFTLLFFFAEPIFSLVFGADWQTAGYIAGWFSFWYYLVFCNAPAGRVIVVCRLQRFALGLNVFTTVLRLGGLILCLILTQDLYVAIPLLAALGVAHNLCYIGMAFYAAYRHDKLLTKVV